MLLFKLTGVFRVDEMKSKIRNNDSANIIIWHYIQNFLKFCSIEEEIKFATQKIISLMNIPVVVGSVHVSVMSLLELLCFSLVPVYKP